MNPAEQRQRHTVTQQLDSKLNDVAVVVNAISTNADVLHRRQTDHLSRIQALEARVQALEADRLDLSQRLDALHIDVVRIAAELRSVEALLRMLQDVEAALARHRDQSFLGRLAWLMGH